MIMNSVKDYGPRGVITQKISLLLIKDGRLNFIYCMLVIMSNVKSRAQKDGNNMQKKSTVMAACPCGEVSGQVNIRPDGSDLF